MTQLLPIWFLLFLGGFCLPKSSYAQRWITHDSLGCTFQLPPQWNYDSASVEKGQVSMHSEDSLLHVRLKRVTVPAGKNSLDFLNDIEALIADAGYYRFEEFDKDSAIARFQNLEPGNPYHAEDLAFGAYVFASKDEYLAEFISVFHRGNTIFMFVLIMPPNQLFSNPEPLNLIYNSFQLTE